MGVCMHACVFKLRGANKVSGTSRTMCNHEGQKFSPSVKCHAANTKVDGLLTRQPCASLWYSRHHDRGTIMLPKPQLPHEILSSPTLLQNI